MRILSRLIALLLVLVAHGLPAAHAEMVPGADIKSVPEAKRVETILRQSESKMDLGRIKLTIDKMIDPTVDVDAGLKQIDGMTAQVRAMLPGFPSSNDRLQTLRAYLYEKGPWNGYQSFDYDFDDPLGKNIRNKLLLNYIASRKGNCVTMPLLFVILGQRLGLDVTISTAPLHLFVKYTDPETGTTYNLEATSGAKPARDVWIRQQNPMTDASIANGLYMQRLSKQETAAVMATVLAEYLAPRQEHEKVIALSDVVLAHYSKDIGSMLRKGSAYGRLAARDFGRKYPMPKLIPPEEYGYFKYLEDQNRLWFAKAEALGWREPDMMQETRYLQAVSRAKSIQ
ncbi:MAG: transglutaminase-like domain-containing protein [Burkholderiaceae bacterium]|nr:transglutaminase-like domain-containing protein [Sulfuritalea sp.]MCF8175263.1 transglutaminase-like domain-containing protein [Burkholderiaceae bacterium]